MTNKHKIRPAYYCSNSLQYTILSSYTIMNQQEQQQQQQEQKQDQEEEEQGLSAMDAIANEMLMEDILAFFAFSSWINLFTTSSSTHGDKELSYEQTAFNNAVKEFCDVFNRCPCPNNVEVDHLILKWKKVGNACKEVPEVIAACDENVNDDMSFEILWEELDNDCNVGMMTMMGEEEKEDCRRKWNAHRKTKKNGSSSGKSKRLDDATLDALTQMLAKLPDKPSKFPAKPPTDENTAPGVDLDPIFSEEPLGLSKAKESPKERLLKIVQGKFLLARRRSNTSTKDPTPQQLTTPQVDGLSTTPLPPTRVPPEENVSTVPLAPKPIEPIARVSTFQRIRTAKIFEWNDHKFPKDSSIKGNTLQPGLSRVRSAGLSRGCLLYTSDAADE